MAAPMRRWTTPSPRHYIVGLPMATQTSRCAAFTLLPGLTSFNPSPCGFSDEYHRTGAIDLRTTAKPGTARIGEGTCTSRGCSFLLNRNLDFWKKTMRFPWLVVLAFVLNAVLGGAAQSSVPIEKIDAVVRAEMDRQHIPGISLLVAGNGKTVLAKGYGLA